MQYKDFSMNLVVGALYVRRRVYSPEYEKLLY